MFFSRLKHYLDLYISDTTLKVSRSLYCFTTSICHGVKNYFPRLWGTGISDAIFSHFTGTYIRENCNSIVLNLRFIKGTLRYNSATSVNQISFSRHEKRVKHH